MGTSNAGYRVQGTGYRKPGRQPMYQLKRLSGKYFDQEANAISAALSGR
jgi:hypothetical protein